MGGEIDLSCPLRLTVPHLVTTPLLIVYMIDLYSPVYILYYTYMVNQ